MALQFKISRYATGQAANHVKMKLSLLYQKVQREMRADINFLTLG